MRSLFMAGLLSLALASPAGAQTRNAESSAAAKPSKYKTLLDRASYAIGLSLGERLSQQLIRPNLAAVSEGLQDGLSGKRQLNDEQLRATMEAFDKEVGARLKERNTQEGEEFLAANKKKAGVKTTKTGLQYKLLKEGKGGKRPAATDTITAHYRGTTVTGEEFDSSYRRGRPLVISVDSVIPGWTEALQMMTVGTKLQLVIPPELAYGEEGMPPAIGPNSTLVFEMELLGIQTPEPLGGAADAPRKSAARPAKRLEER